MGTVALGSSPSTGAPLQVHGHLPQRRLAPTTPYKSASTRVQYGPRSAPAQAAHGRPALARGRPRRVRSDMPSCPDPHPCAPGRASRPSCSSAATIAGSLRPRVGLEHLLVLQQMRRATRRTTMSSGHHDNSPTTRRLRAAVAGRRQGRAPRGCIVVTYERVAAGHGDHYGATGGTGLDAYLDLKVTRGTIAGTPGPGSCTTSPATHDYISRGAASSTTGTLQGWADTSAAALADPKPGRSGLARAATPTASRPRSRRPRPRRARPPRSRSRGKRATTDARRALGVVDSRTHRALP